MEQDKPLIGRLASGESVVDRYVSHARHHRVSSELLVRALSSISASGREFLIEEVRFQQPVGHSQCVRTTRSDDVVYAQRPKRAGLSRFVRNRAPEPCNAVVVILKQVEPDASGVSRFMLITAYVGNRAPPEPWDKMAFENDPALYQTALDFWCRHALIFRSEPFVAGSVTRRFPWGELYGRRRQVDATPESSSDPSSDSKGRL